ncbi:MAG: hypothetical protein QOJ76_2435 [Acidobacteriota bacterium]|jgi:hypothetical protein|nr:hypothetical protein [Acidobacteriota bacterium]
MNVRPRALATALAFAFACIAPAPTVSGAGLSRAPQAESQRRPQGPVAGPVIKLPRGEGAGDDRAQQQQPSSSSSAAKDEGSHIASAPHKWEYCTINGFSYHQKGFSSTSITPAAVIHYFPGITEEVEGVSEDEAVANAFVKLGDDGWERAGIRTDFRSSDGNGNSMSVYYFKRPKR